MSPSPADTTQRRRRVIAVLVAALLAGIVATVAAGVVTDHQARTSRSFCVNCHATVRTHGTGHRDAPCQSCHQSGLAARLALGVARFTGARPAAGHAVPRSSTCATCHRDHTPNGAFATTSGHNAHARGAHPVDCIRCHGGSLHERPSRTETCMSCHASVPMLAEPRDERSCVRCHDFTTDPTTAVAALRTGVTGTGPQIDASRIHGGVDCRLCHNPHRPTNDPAAPLGTRCTQCHRGNIQAQVEAGPAGHRTCLGCHAVHADRRNGAPQCDRCHTAPQRTLIPGAPVPGAPATLARAARGRRGAPVPPPVAPGASGAPPAAGTGGVTTALRTWVTLPNVRPPAIPDADWLAANARPRNPTFTHGGRCASCHRPHTWRAQATDCRNCHNAMATSLGLETPHGRNGCLGCHDPHGPRPNASACAACHATQARSARSAPPAPHRLCTSCHQPHDPVRPTAATCSHCHQAMRDRMAGGPPQHQNCISCHTPHGPPRPQTPGVCSNCHSTVTNWFATNAHPPQHRCEGCHANHDFSRPAARTACMRCHQDLASHRGSHMSDCVSCHTPHAPVPARDVHNCISCHTTQVLSGPPRMQAGHARCQGCHQPHRPRATAATQCGNCHAAQRATASSWPAGSPHAGNCVQCHQPHRPDGAFPVCGSCHAPQANTNHFGRHAACIMCHAPHRERPAGGRVGWWTRCAECHRTEAAGASAPTTSATHRLCANCHQRPGLRAPTCVTCHAAIPSTLLHSVGQHSNCITCHTRHGNAPPARAQCVACHADRVTHFTDAPRCQSCHPFRQSNGGGGGN